LYNDLQFKCTADKHSTDCSYQHIFINRKPYWLSRVIVPDDCLENLHMDGFTNCMELF